MYEQLTESDRKIVLRMAAKNLEAARKRFADYKEECAADYAKGYRPSACIHGVSQWTDYDNICGWCEDGYGYWDYLKQAELALEEAKGTYAEYQKRQGLYRAARDMNAPEKLLGEIFEWVLEVFK